MGRRKDEHQLERQLEEHRFELQQCQQDLNLWRGVALTFAGVVLTLILYIRNLRH